MNRSDEGVLLLCCNLGDPQCSPLTTAQFRQLGLRVRAYGTSADPLSELSIRELTHLGYSSEEADRILSLLNRQAQLHRYLAEGERRGIVPLTRVSEDYPVRLSVHKKFSAPPVLFAMGDLSLLKRPAISVVGSRQIRRENREFARDVGRCAAQEGYVLVSGGAAGADLAAQEACMQAGGQCIVCVPDSLLSKRPADGVLYLSENGYDVPFTSARALHRNELIHMLGEKTVAAQCTYGQGGTWQGSIENLKHGWSQLFVFDDDSDGSCALMERGACGIREVRSISDLTVPQLSLFSE